MADTSNCNARGFRRKLTLSMVPALLALAALPAFAQTSVTNRASVTPPAGVSNPGTACQAVAGNTYDSSTGTCTASDTDTVVVPILTLGKTSNGPWLIGQAGAQYTLTPGNTGTAPTSGTVTVVDTLPVGITPNFPSPLAINGWTCSASGQTVTCTSVAVITNGGSGTNIVLPVNVTATAANPSVNYAAISGGGDPDPAPTPGPACTPAAQCATNSTPVTASADVQLVKTLTTAGPYVAGQTVTYSVVVTNNGPSTATAVNVTDTPTNLTITTVAGQGGIVCTAFPCNIGNLASGASATINVTGTVGAAGGAFNNSATATSPVTDPTPGNNTDDAPATATASADVQLVKTLTTAGPYVAGQTVTYSVVVTNNGPSTATAVNVTDTPTNLTITTVAGQGGIVCTAFPCNIGSLASGASATINVTGTVGAAGGAFNNSATATSPVTDPTPGNNTDDAPATATASADVQLVKTLTTAGPYVAGQTVTYSVVVTNNGPSTATAVNVTDTPTNLTITTVAGQGGIVCTAFPCNIGNLASGASATINVTGTVGAAGGAFNNSATATSPVTDPTPGNNTDDAPATATASADVSVSKSVDIASPIVGTNVDFTVVVLNNGPSDATGVSVTDQLPAGYTYVSDNSGGQYVPGTGVWTVGALPVGANSVLHITASVNAAGPYLNMATVTATTPDPNLVNNTATANTTPVAAADVQLVKTLTTAGPYVAGQTVTYSVVVTNNGPSTATAVNVTDTPTNLTITTVAGQGGIVCTAFPCNIGSLASGASATINVTGTVGAAGGAFNNSATATSPVTDPTPGNNTDDAPATATASADLSIDKAVNNATPTVGGNVTFTLTVLNNGPSNATGVSVQDSLPSGYTYISDNGGGAYVAGTGVWTLPAGLLASGASATLQITARVEETGPYVNIATVTAATADPDTNNNADSATTSPVANPGLTIVKTQTSGPNPVTTSGVTLGYSIVVTNTGNVSQTGVVVSDTLPNGAPGTLSAVVESITANNVLEVGETWTYTISYVVQQSDIDAGTSLVNTATVTTVQVPTPTTDTAVTSLTATPALTLLKSTTATSYASVGQVLSYSYLVTNAGNTTISTAITVSDDRIATVSCPALPGGVLAPTQSITCTATYTVTQSDLDSGSVTNVASASDGTTTSPTSTVTVNATQAPALTLLKSTTATSYASVGQVLSYSYLVTNAGNTTISTAITVSDDRIATVSCPALPGGVLAPTQSITCTATYTVTQSDLDSGSVTNVASASDGTTTSPTSTVTVNATQAPALTLLKSTTATSYASVGQVLSYSYLVTNAGNTTISTAITVSDDRIATVSCPALPGGVLAPTQSITCTATYTVTQSDLDSGSVTNVASASDGTTTSPTSTVTVNATQAPALTLLKSTTATSYASVGQVLSYSYLVTNAGNTTISTAITVSDDRIATVSCPALPGGVLAPTQSITCTATYTVTQSDLDSGSVTNVASASDGTTTSPTSTVTVNATQAPALTLLKSTTATSYASVGQVLSYSYLVTNAGNTTISTAITVSDDRIATVSCPALPGGVLAPTQSITCTATYTVTQSDLDSGSVTNVASASDGTTTSPTSTVTVNATQAPAQSLLKALTSNADQDGSGTVTLGDTLTYTVTVTNTGNTTLTNIVVNDPLTTPASITCVNVTPGATCELVGIYTVLATDVFAGQVSNTAVSTSPVCPVGSTAAACTTTVNVAVVPASTSVTKSVSTAGPVLPGTVLTYTLTTVVTGSATAEAVTLTDTLGNGLAFGAVTVPGVYICSSSLVCTLPAGTLPGTYAVSYTATVDADATGNVSNAVVASTPPGGDPDPVCTTCTTDTPVTASSTTLSKLVDAAGPVLPGATLTYTLRTVVSNSATTESITLTDTLGSGLTFVAVTVPGAYGCTGSLVCTLPAGTLPGTYEVVYTATVNADATTGTLTNAVVASTPPGGDPDPVCTTCTTDTPVTATSATVNKTVNPASGSDVNPGQVLTYTLTTVVANSATTEDIALTDTLGAGLTFGSVTNAGAYLCTGSLVCVLPAGTLPGSYAVVYTATVNTGATGSVGNSVTASTPPGGDPDPVCATCTTDNPLTPSSSSVTKSVNAAGVVNPGQTLTYTLTTVIAGSATSDVITLTDTLGSGLTFGAVTSAGVYNCTGALVCTLPTGTLPGTYALSYTAVVNAGATGSVNNVVTASTPGSNPQPICTTCETNTPVATAVVTVDKTSDPASGTSVLPGSTLTYTVTVTVANSATTGPVTLTDTLSGDQTLSGNVPAGCATTAGGLVCTLATGSLPGVYPFTYTSTVDQDAVGNVGNVVVPTGNDNPVCGTACVTTHPVLSDTALRLQKTAAVRDAKIGDLVRYTLTVENVGDAPFINGYVLDTPPAGFSYVEGSLSVIDGDNLGVAVGQSPIRFEGLDIAVGQSATLVYSLRVGAGVRPGVHVNQAQAFNQAGDPLSNASTADVTLVADALVEDSLLIGTVFDDRDGDGWQDRADLSGVRVQGGFAPAAYVPNSTTVDRGAGAKPEADASSPLLHGIAIGAISARQSVADPASDHQIVIRQRLSDPAFTNDFVLTSAQGVTVRMDAAGNTTVEKSGEAAKGLNAAEPRVERRVAQGQGGYVVDYVISNLGIDERGIPGVRIASVEGLLIETDQFGRYHLEGVHGGDTGRGRNFILKVDPSTLPPGTVFTTDNPLLRRITQGVPVRFDFGVKLPVEEVQGGEQPVELELGEVIFAPGSAKVRDEYAPVIEQIASKVTEYRGGEVLVSANGDSEALAFDRANAVKQALLSQLPAEVSKALTVSVRADLDDPSTLIVGIAEGGPLLGTVLFDTDKSVVKPQFLPVLDKVAGYLDEKDGGAVAIVGHADPRGSDAYNVALGLRRAKAVYELIAAKLSPEVRAKVRVESSNDPAAPAGTSK